MRTSVTIANYLFPYYMKKTFAFLVSLVVSLVVDAADATVISFADPHVKSVCVEHWDTDGDGELSTDEAAAVKSLSHYFSNDKNMSSFDELQYFTGLLSIASLEFFNCENLSSIQLPPQIKKISDNAFRSCYQLTSIHIPGSATSIGDNAFNGCFRLASVTFGEGVKTIGKLAFTSCSALQSLDIPSSMTDIAANAFQGCESIAAITVAPGNTVYDSREDCNAIVNTSTNTMVLGCYNSTFPSSVTAIGMCAFLGCSMLQSVVIPEGITTIEESAFTSCMGLVNVVLPTTLTTIGNNAFSECRKLTDVHLAEGLTSIGASAFEQCRSLASISIPSTVNTLSNNVFNNCPKLVEVTVGFSTPLTIYGGTFSNRTNATLYVPIGSVEAFENANYWKDFWYIKEKLIPGDVNHDGSVNVLDVTLVIDYILDKNPEDFHYEEANVNGDEYINVLDVTKISDIILGK